MRDNHRYPPGVAWIDGEPAGNGPGTVGARLADFYRDKRESPTRTTPVAGG